MSTDKRAEEQAQAQVDSIKELFTAWKQLDDSDAEQVEADGCEFTDADEVTEHAQESALSVETRGPWHNPGEKVEDDEFCILLCTGGPAVRIVGDINSGSPDDIKVQYQDWGTPWTDFSTDSDEDEALEWFCGLFYFGE